MAFCLTGTFVSAQSDGQSEPMSAIEWLSRSVEPIPLYEPPAVGDATSPNVQVTPLDRPSKDPIGLLPSDVTGLPRSLWAASDEAVAG